MTSSPWSPLFEAALVKELQTPVEKLTHIVTSGGQHLPDVVQVAVVDLRSDAQDVAHEWVDVDRLKGLHHQVPAKGGSHSPEEGLHVHLVVVVAVLALVELHREVLRDQKETHHESE